MMNGWMVTLPGICTGDLLYFPPHSYQGILIGFSEDGDGMNAGLFDGSTDESDNVWMEGNYPGI